MIGVSDIVVSPRRAPSNRARPRRYSEYCNVDADANAAFQSCGFTVELPWSDRGIESVGDTFVSAAPLNRERQAWEISGMNGLSPNSGLVLSILLNVNRRTKGPMVHFCGVQTVGSPGIGDIGFETALAGKNSMVCVMRLCSS